MPVVCTAPCAAAAAAAAAAVSVATESRAVVATMVIVMVMVVAMVAESTFLWSPRIVFTAAAEAASPKNAHHTHTTARIHLHIYKLFDFFFVHFILLISLVCDLAFH